MVQIGPAGNPTELIPGTAPADLGKAEDAPHVSGDTGVMSLAVRNDTGATFTSLDGDYSPIGVDAAGRVGVSGLIPGVAATNLGKAEDAPSVSGDTGVLVLGVRNDTMAAQTNLDLDYGAVAVTQKGAAQSAILSLSNLSVDASAAAPAFARDPGDVTSRSLLVHQLGFNGTTYDRWRNNIDTAALITAAGATTGLTGTDQTNFNGRGAIIVLDMTNAGTGSVTLVIEGKDIASGKYYTLLAGTAVVSVVTNTYYVFPGATVTANVSANAPLPRTWRVRTTVANANPTTYTVGASIIL